MKHKDHTSEPCGPVLTVKQRICNALYWPLMNSQLLLYNCKHATSVTSLWKLAMHNMNTCLQNYYSIRKHAVIGFVFLLPNPYSWTMTGIYSASNRNEYQKILQGVKHGCPSASRLCGQSVVASWYGQPKTWRDNVTRQDNTIPPPNLKKRHRHAQTRGITPRLCCLTTPVTNWISSSRTPQVKPDHDQLIVANTCDRLDRSPSKVDSFPAFSGARRFITVFSTCPYPEWDQSNPRPPLISLQEPSY
jgi:hypothetical protein